MSKHRLLKTKTTPKTTTPHMTPKRMRTEPEHIGEKHGEKTKRGYLVDQLAKHGWRWPRTRSGRNAKRTQK